MYLSTSLRNSMSNQLCGGLGAAELWIQLLFRCEWFRASLNTILQNFHDNYSGDETKAWPGGDAQERSNGRCTQLKEPQPVETPNEQKKTLRYIYTRMPISDCTRFRSNGLISLPVSAKLTRIDKVQTSNPAGCNRKKSGHTN